MSSDDDPGVLSCLGYGLGMLFSYAVSGWAAWGLAAKHEGLAWLVVLAGSWIVIGTIGSMVLAFPMAYLMALVGLIFSRVSPKAKD